MIRSDEIDGPLERARQYAALSSSFDPLEAISAALPDDIYDSSLAARILAKLRADCADAPGGDGWIMRQTRRADVLSTADRGQLASSLPENLPDDPESRQIRDTYLAEPGVVEARLAEVLQAPKKKIEQIESLAKAISQVGKASEAAYRMLPVLRSTLNRNETIEQAKRLFKEHGYFGNGRLRKRLADWIDYPPDMDFAQAKYISGIPGVGKSFLLLKLVQEARRRSNPVVLVLDFDRRGLNLVDADGLSLELSRQVADEIPESAARLTEMRANLSNENARQYEKSSSGSASLPLLDIMGEAIRDSGRKVLLVLDTLEVLRSYGRTHPARLFEYLDQLIRAGIRPVAILGAGRGDALDVLRRDRLEEKIPLANLPKDVARKMLKELGTPAVEIEPIILRSRCNPLLLRLSAKLAKEGKGGEEIELHEGQDPEVAGAFLYRAILSRIDTPLLKEVANLGLVLSRVNARSISEIIGPALGKSISPDQAQELFTELSTHHWLVDEEPEPGWVRHRSDVRSVILPLLYEDQEPAVAEVNRLAAQAYADSNPQLALYHRLQLVAAGEAMPEVPPSLAAEFSDQMIEELPVRAADAVHLARRERSRSGRDAPREPERPAGVSVEATPSWPDETTLQDMEILLEKRDFEEAEIIYRRQLREFDDPGTPAGAVAMCHLWLTGQWSSASRIFKNLASRNFEIADKKHGHPLYRLVALEMRAEFDFDRLVDELSYNPDFWKETQDVYRQSRDMRLTEGPLVFALLASSRDFNNSGGWREEIGVAATGLGEADQQSLVIRDATALRDRYFMDLNSEVLSFHEIASTLSPYSQPVSTFAALSRGSALWTYLHGIGLTFEQMAAVPFKLDEEGSSSTRLLSSADQMVLYLGAAGATADWLSAYAFFHSTPNVPLIARRAETWRRVVAGRWAYGGKPPEGWEEPEEGIDYGTMNWLESLADHPEPAEEAARQLLYWADPRLKEGEEDGAVQIGKRARTRLGAHLFMAIQAARRSRSEPPHLAAVRPVLSREVGRSIAVPLAILAAKGARNRQEAGRYQSMLMESAGAEFTRMLMED